MKRRLNIGIGLHTCALSPRRANCPIDPQSRNAIPESVEHLSSEGMAVLYTTHYGGGGAACDRVAIIDEGKIKAEGTRRELVRWWAKDRSRSRDMTGCGDAAPGAVGVFDVPATERTLTSSLTTPVDPADLLARACGRREHHGCRGSRAQLEAVSTISRARRQISQLPATLQITEGPKTPCPRSLGVIIGILAPGSGFIQSDLWQRRGRSASSTGLSTWMAQRSPRHLAGAR
jgi:hypothetical protein